MFKPCCAWGLVLVVAGLSVAGETPPGAGQEAAPNPEAIKLLERPASELRIEKALDEPATFDLVDVPLDAVMKQVSQRHGIRIHMDRRAMEPLGIDSDTPITFKIAGIRLRSALELMLRDVDMTYLVRDEVLLLTTPEGEETELDTLVYDVTDLVFMEDARKPGNEDFDTLIELLTTTIRPDSWSEVGGGTGQIREYILGDTRALVVTQTQAIHRHFTQLLADLRKPSPLGTRGDRWQCEAERRIEAVLDQPIAIEVKEVSLNSLVRQLGQQYEIPIIVVRKSLEPLGIDPNVPITFAVSDVRVRSALRLLARDLELDYTVSNEALVISTPDDLEGRMTTRVYDVKDLVTFQDSQGLQWEDGDSLMELIPAMVHPDAWAEVCGGHGQICFFPNGRGGMLVITQTYGMHRQIADLFARLRQVGPPVPPEGPFPVRPRPTKPEREPRIAPNPLSAPPHEEIQPPTSPKGSPSPQSPPPGPRHQ